MCGVCGVCGVCVVCVWCVCGVCVVCVWCVCACVRACVWAQHSSTLLSFPPLFPAVFLSLPSLPRLAAEEQIQGLQGLIDETFKQFALDDSEDDFEEDSEGSVYNGEWGGGTPEAKKRALYTNPTIV